MDTYKTILTPSPEILFKEKNSKFYGYTFPVTSEDEVKFHLAALRKNHSGAGHFCYAWQIGTDKISFRTNDDGEPGNSAGMPIYGQIQSFAVTNVLVTVVRYFGGVKLGVGGLMSAYKSSAQLALQASHIIEKTIDVHFKITFDYKLMNKVMRIIKEKNLAIITQSMELDCEIIVAARKKHEQQVGNAFYALFEVKVEKVEI